MLSEGESLSRAGLAVADRAERGVHGPIGTVACLPLRKESSGVR
jgi:hypothetical protein